MTAGFAGGLHDKVANLIMAAPSVGWVDLSVINGDIIVKDGVLQTLDLQVLTLLLCMQLLPEQTWPACSASVPSLEVLARGSHELLILVASLESLHRPAASVSD